MAEHDAKRLASRLGRGVVAHRELGIVAPHRPRPDEHCVALGAQAMNVASRLGAGYPPTRAVWCRRPPIESRGQLEHDVGPAG
jgi:hypothetical protein